MTSQDQGGRRVRTFDSVIGHREIIEHLQNAVRMGKVSHAYLISGEEGSGKKLLAGIFAAALQCERGGTNPARYCPSCKKAESGSHPDIIRITHEKPSSIGVRKSRNQLVDDVAIKPYSGPYRSI